MNISNRLISTAARQRAAALLKELSLEEKVRQLGCTMLVSEDTDLTAKDLSGRHRRNCPAGYLRRTRSTGCPPA